MKVRKGLVGKRKGCSRSELRGGQERVIRVDFIKTYTCMKLLKNNSVKEFLRVSLSNGEIEKLSPV